MGFPAGYWTVCLHKLVVVHLYICCSPFLQADLLDVVGVLYVGGLPQNYTTKRIGPVRTQTLDHSLFLLVKTEKKTCTKTDVCRLSFPDSLQHQRLHPEHEDGGRSRERQVTHRR